MPAELSHLRYLVYAAQADPSEALATADRFLADHKNDPFVKSYRADLWLTLSKLAEQFAALARQQHDEALLTTAKQTREKSKSFKPQPPGRDDPDEAGMLIAVVEAEIAHYQKKQLLLARLSTWQQEPSVKAVKDARYLAKQGGLDEDPDIKNGITQ